jgi:hypothetical protein
MQLLCRALLFISLIFHCCILVLADVVVNGGPFCGCHPGCKGNDKRDKFCIMPTVTVVWLGGNPPPTETVVTVVRTNPTAVETVVFPMTTASIVRTSETPAIVVPSKGWRKSKADKIAIAIEVLIFLTFLVIV